MKKLRAGLALVLVGLMVAGASVATAQENRNFRATMSGAEEVPLNDTMARGTATFELSEDGTELRYRLTVRNIENVTQAHIHQGPPGVNGPVVLWLYPAAPPSQLIPGRFDGVLGEGTATAADLVGPLAGGSMDDLMELIRTGNAYVNVHTSQFPPGEIRGQIGDDFAIGPGFRQRIEDLALRPLGPEVFFAPGYSFILTDQGPMFYSEFTNEMVGPFPNAPLP